MSRQGPLRGYANNNRDASKIVMMVFENVTKGRRGVGILMTTVMMMVGKMIVIMILTRIIRGEV